jgi:hypothetical protein
MASPPSDRITGLVSAAIIAGRRSWITITLALFALTFLALASGPTAAQNDGVTAHIFWREGCSYCARAKEAVAEIGQRVEGLRVEEIELGVTPENDALFYKMLTLFEAPDAAIPFVVIGEGHVVGFAGGGRSVGVYEGLIERCLIAGCVDLTSEMRRLSDIAAGRTETRTAGLPAVSAGPPASVTIPWLGAVALTDLSLPMLTVVLAGIDGFNPCAMWVLVLLIGLLVGVADSRRMWTLGLIFLLATGAMYFAVMAAWLNVVLWIGAVIWLRIAIGALAVGAGLYYLREYWTNPGGLCRVTGSGTRRRFTDAFRSVVEQPSLPIAALGIAALAIAVNLIELVCSAGVPAIYTQMLAMHDLTIATYYGYLALYLLVFLLDDAAIFVTAMITLRAATSTGRYARGSHLIGGAVLLGLGGVMLLRPEWLG